MAIGYLRQPSTDAQTFLDSKHWMQWNRNLVVNAGLQPDTAYPGAV